MKAQVSEIFVSMQGEGKYLGEEQCFVRFYNCNLACGYCDTKLSDYRLYGTQELLDALKQEIGARPVRTVSFTGGEPLLQRDFLVEFVPLVKKEGLRCYLETNGVLADELFDVIDYVDVVAMDIKLPSSTGQREFWGQHEAFLKISQQKEVFVKAVVCEGTLLEDCKRAVKLVADIDPEISFIIQPNSSQLGRVLADKMREFKEYARHYLADVRIIPQVHKIMGVR